MDGSLTLLANSFSLEHSWVFFAALVSAPANFFPDTSIIV